MFGLGKKTAQPPEFSRICIMLSRKDAIAQFTANALNERKEPCLRKVRAMQYLLMGTSGNFIVDFHDELGNSLRPDQKYIRSTNLDVIAVETIIWLAFYSLQLWKKDKTTDPEAFTSIEGRIFHGAALWAIMLLAKNYGLDSKKYVDHRWRYYSDGFNESDDLSTLFPSIIFKSIGKKNFDDVGVFDNPMETLKLNWIVVYTYANSFSVEKSNAAYGTIKSIVRDWQKFTGKTLQEDTEYDDCD